MLASETMTLSPGFPSASAVSSAKLRSLVPSPSLRNCGLTASTFMYQVPGARFSNSCKWNEHRWHVLGDRTWIVGNLITNQTAGTLAVVLNDRRVPVREAAFLALSTLAAYIPGGLTWLRHPAPQIKRHAFPGIVDQFGKHSGVVNLRGPE